MKNLTKTIWIYFLLVPALFVSASNMPDSVPGTPEVGDILVIDAPEGSNYFHINFPKPNIILKRSGVYKIESVLGVAVEIIEVKEQKDGSFQVRLQPVDGKKFFRHWRSVTANYQKALELGELRKKSD